MQTKPSRWEIFKRLLVLSILLPLFLIGALTFIVYQKQGNLIQKELTVLNQSYEGQIAIADSHIAPFKNFPYISIKVDSVRVYESKKQITTPILDVADIYIGFNIWDLVNGIYDVQKLLIEDGYCNLIIHENGLLNIENAFTNPNKNSNEEEPFDIHLKNIELLNLDIHTLDESSMTDIETLVYWAKSELNTGNNEIDAHLDTEFELNIIENQDTSFIKHKHFEFHTDILYNELSGLLEISPSGIKMENGDFEIQGNIDTKADLDLDIHINGTKPNFDMLIAFAPENLIPTLERYNNAGEFYFNADITGPVSGQMPFIDLTFGANEAFLENVDVRKKVEDMGFKGHFTNGKDKSLRTMEFSLEDFTSKLDRGKFLATIFVKNFEEPDVKLDLNTDFDLEFLTQFFNLSYIENASGKVKLDMKFHDIIDLKHPENALSQLNQSYFSELNIENLHVESPDLRVPIDQLDMHLAMNGKRGEIDKFNLKMGASDLSLTGFVTDLPAIVHHTDIPVEAELEISAKLIDLVELTGFVKGDSTGINEQIKDLNLLLKAKSSARAITESKSLPEGEFFIEKLNAQLNRFPHELHDFHADVLIDSADIKVVDFTGYIDKSDFHFSGEMNNYGSLMEDSLDFKPIIPVIAELEMRSDLIDLAELTSYSKEDSTGLDEQIKDFNIQVKFNSTAGGLMDYKHLPIGEFFIDDLHAQLKHYPHELHDFNADILIGDEDLEIVDFTGYIDDSDFHLNGDILDYGFWMKDTLAGDVKLDLDLSADKLRLEDVFSYNGKNYVPEDYRHEQFNNLKLHVNGEMHYRDSGLHSVDVDLDQFEAKMKVHPMRFEDFSGRVHYEDEHLILEKMHGKIGRTVFDADVNYYLGEDESIKLRDNHVGLKANYIDYDQLFAFDTKSSNTLKDTLATTADVEAHSKAFNLYELPFTDMTIDVDVDHFIYHHIDIQNIHSRLRTTKDHYIYVDTMRAQAADGDFYMSGYFNGSNPDKIYLSPNLKVVQADLDQLLFKYENFGEDEFMSDYVHGKVSADIKGNIRVYPDMIPDIDQSEIHMDIEILNGRLENYEPVQMLSDYMGDKDLSLVQFDTLQNHMDITNGTINIPNMTIESTLGHLELSGAQSMSGDLDYLIRIPWKLVKQSARNKLFGSKKTKDGDTGDDEIIEKDPKKKVRYLNLRVKGTLEDYEVKLKDKSTKNK